MAKYIVIHSPLDAKVYAGDTFSLFAKERIGDRLGTGSERHGVASGRVHEHYSRLSM